MVICLSCFHHFVVVIYLVFVICWIIKLFVLSTRGWGPANTFKWRHHKSCHFRTIIFLFLVPAPLIDLCLTKSRLFRHIKQSLFRPFWVSFKLPHKRLKLVTRLALSLSNHSFKVTIITVQRSFVRIETSVELFRFIHRHWLLKYQLFASNSFRLVFFGWVTYMSYCCSVI